MASKFDFCSLPTNFLNIPLTDFNRNLPIVAPVAPTRAKINGSSKGSITENVDNIIQVGGISNGTALTAINSKNIPR